MTSSTFWFAALERAVKTFAQTFAALLSVDQLASIIDIDWLDAASVSAVAAVISLLTSVGSGAVTSQPGPSLTNAEVLKE